VVLCAMVTALEEAMKQVFTMMLPDMSEITQESAKREIYKVAGEMGFPYCGEPIIKQSKDGAHYIDWDFYTSLEESFEKIAGM
jgi:predicted ATP-grasp superfamily ATP-dependent carboligase